MSEVSSKPNTVIRFVVADAYRTDGKQLMGRQSANEGFLKAWLRYSGHSEFMCLARSKAEAEQFAVTSKNLLRPEQIAAGNVGFRWMQQMQMHRAESYGTVFLPGPQVAHYAWRRRRDVLAKTNGASLVGMTHTTCEMSIIDNLADMLHAPVFDWDAQICPSNSVQQMVKRVLDDEAAFMREHTGATRIPTPQLPVIPLGVHSADFAPDPALRSEWRKRWGLSEHDVCILYMGRIDLQTKANLLPMFDALALAASQTTVPLTLVLAGWFVSENTEKIVKAALQGFEGKLRVIIEDGRTPEARRGVWRAADVFTSLVDNIQETFGLVPIEAMAAGLPVVVTDYDGYKESVRHGIDGFKIRTLQAPRGAGKIFMERHDDVMDNYFTYVGRASWFVGFDIHAAAQAFVKLAENPQLRQQMGQAGMARAKKEYDWAGIVPQMQTLFSELAARRAAYTGKVNVATLDNMPALHPRRSDPFHQFSHYPSEPLQPTMQVSLLINDWRPYLSMQMARPIYQASGDFLNAERAAALLQWLAAQSGAVSLAQLAQQFAKDPFDTLRTTVWLFKVGLIHISAA